MGSVLPLLRGGVGWPRLGIALWPPLGMPLACWKGSCGCCGRGYMSSSVGDETLCWCFSRLESGRFS